MMNFWFILMTKKGQSSLEYIEKKYGKNVLGDGVASIFSVIPSGSFLLDDMLGVGGYPLGRSVEIFGPESAAKTTLCLSAAREAQRLNCKVAFIDTEGTLDLNWAEKIGVDIRKPMFQPIWPEYAEQALDIFTNLIPDFSLIILDSIAALLPKAEAQGEVGDRNIGLVARLMSQVMRITAPTLKRENSVVIFTNQLRDNIGSQGYGPSSTTTGGQALKYYSSIRITAYRSTYLGPDDAPLGNELKVTITKNKVAPPRKKGVLTIYYDEGISQSQELLNFGLESGAIKRSGAWYSFPLISEDDPPKVQGGLAARNLLNSDQKIRCELENKLRRSLGLPIIGGIEK